MIAIISLVLSIIGLIGLALHVILSDSAHGGIAHRGSGAEEWLQEMGFFKPEIALTAPTLVSNATPITPALTFAVFPNGPPEIDVDPAVFQ